MKKKVLVVSIFAAFIFTGSYLVYKHSIESAFDKFVLNDQLAIADKENPKEEYHEQITALKAEYQNDDVVGTLEIPNTDFKVPVVQGTDNKYYLKHLPNKEYSIMGSIFLDYRVDIDNSRKILIYGHNSSSYKMPFAILENYYDENYLKEHKNVIIKTTNKIRKYEIFSLYIATTDFTYMKVNFDDNNYKKHLSYLKKQSMLNIDTEVTDENILVLQTCSTHKDYLKYKKKYLVLAFKEVHNE